MKDFEDMQLSILSMLEDINKMLLDYNITKAKERLKIEIQALKEDLIISNRYETKNGVKLQCIKKIR